MAVLRYIGTQPTTFKDSMVMPRRRDEPQAPPIIARVGELQPLQEFSVPDELAERYIHRADIEVIVPPVAPPEDARPADAEPEDAAPEDAAPEDAAPAEETPADAAESAEPAPAAGKGRGRGKAAAGSPAA